MASLATCAPAVATVKGLGGSSLAATKLCIKPSHLSFRPISYRKDKAKDAIFYSYTRHINGFAAILEDEEAVQIAKHPKVVSVFLNRGRKLHTTRSWNFMGLEDNGVIPSGSIWKKATYGENTIIGNLDTVLETEEPEGMADEHRLAGVIRRNNDIEQLMGV